MSLEDFVRAIRIPQQEQNKSSILPIFVSVTRLGDLLHFGQQFNAFCNNQFAQISYIHRQFL